MRLLSRCMLLVCGCSAALPPPAVVAAAAAAAAALAAAARCMLAAAFGRIAPDAALLLCWKLSDAWPRARWAVVVVCVHGGWVC
jgi:hypothetical protein